MTPTEEKLLAANQNLSAMLAAVIKFHGGWLVLQPGDLARVKPTDTILIQDGPRPHEILLRVL